MAFHRIDEFDLELQMMSSMAKCIAHPARISILQTLMETREATFEELLNTLPLGQSTVSHHLRYLVNNGILEIKEILPHTIYSFSKDGFAKPLQNTMRLCEDLMGVAVS